MLVDLEEDEPRTIQGVFYGTPFMDDIVRVAARHRSGASRARLGPRGAFNAEAWRKGSSAQPRLATRAQRL